MAESNFFMELIATLNKAKSKKQIKSDIKDMGEMYLPLTGKLNKTNTKKQIKQQLKDINADVNLNTKVNTKTVTSSVRQATTQAQKTADAKPIELNFSIRKEKLINDIRNLGKANSKLFKSVDMTQKYNGLLDSAKLAANNDELKNLRLRLSAFRSELKATNLDGLTLADTFKKGIKRAGQLFGSYGIIMTFRRQLQNASSQALELDTALTDLARVNSEITRDKLPEYLDSCISKCKELKVAVNDYISSVTDFSRSGYDLADSETLAEMAIQLQHVGDMDINTASKTLLSGLQAYDTIDGYGMDQLAEKAQALNDKIDLIGNTASITQAELAEGIQSVGSVMEDANTSVDEFLSLLAAGNRSVQDANKVALAIRTSALRIRAASSDKSAIEELEAMGESTDDLAVSVASLRKEIMALTNVDGLGGIDILEADEKTFRSIYEIYNDIAKVQEKMSDLDYSNLINLIAGKNRSNQISSILGNMEEANKLLESSLNAAGTATEEYAVYLDSAQAAIEKFGVQVTETYNNIINGETVKNLTNLGSATLEFANSMGLVESSLKGGIAIGAMKFFGMLTMAIKGSYIQLNAFGKALNTAKNIKNLQRGTLEYANALNTLKNSCVSLTEAQLKQVL